MPFSVFCRSLWDDTTSSAAETYQVLLDKSEFLTYSTETTTRGVESISVKNESSEFTVGYTLEEEETQDSSGLPQSRDGD